MNILSFSNFIRSLSVFGHPVYCLVLLILFPIMLMANNDYIATTDIHVRIRPEKESAILFILHRDEQVDVISTQNYWSKIRFYGRTGYVHSRFLIKSENTESQNSKDNNWLLLIIPLLFIPIYFLIKQWLFNKQRIKRRNYYRNVYLKSEEWQRKRHVVLERDNRTCVYCGNPATQIHHLRYAKYNIGKEPIDWLVSICKSCHEDQHK